MLVLVLVQINDIFPAVCPENNILNQPTVHLQNVCVPPSRGAAQHDEWTGFILSMCDYLEEMRSPLEMNKCGIYVSINI